MKHVLAAHQKKERNSETRSPTMKTTIVKTQVKTTRGAESRRTEDVEWSTVAARFRRIGLFALSLCLLVVPSVKGFGQLTTADILGTVTDPTGAAVPNAGVTLTNLGTNNQRSVQSNGSGEYTFTLLPVGHYSISVKVA